MTDLILLFALVGILFIVILFDGLIIWLLTLEPPLIFAIVSSLLACFITGGGAIWTKILIDEMNL